MHYYLEAVSLRVYVLFLVHMTPAKISDVKCYRSVVLCVQVHKQQKQSTIIKKYNTRKAKVKLRDSSVFFRVGESIFRN